MAFERRSYAGGAPPTTLNVSISSGDLAIVVDDADGYPTGVDGPFAIVLGRGTASEEKVLCSGRTGATFTVSARGYDGTAAVAHASAVTVEHCVTAVDLDEANRTAAQTLGAVTTSGDILVGTGASSVARLGKGTQHYPLLAGATTLSYGQLTAAGTGFTYSDWTPTLTGSSSWTIGDGTIASRYVQLGKMVFYSLTITYGSTTSLSGRLIVAPPISINATNHPDRSVVGVASFYDQSVTTQHSGLVLHRTGEGFNVYLDQTLFTNSVSNATGDILSINGSYEASS